MSIKESLLKKPLSLDTSPSTEFLEATRSLENLVNCCSPLLEQKTTPAPLEDIPRLLEDFSQKVSSPALSNEELKKIQEIGKDFFSITDKNGCLEVDFFLNPLEKAFFFSGEPIKVIEKTGKSHTCSFSAQIKQLMDSSGVIVSGAEAKIFDLFSSILPQKSPYVLRVAHNKKDELPDVEKYRAVEERLSAKRKISPDGLVGIMPPTKQIQIRYTNVNTSAEKVSHAVLMAKGKGDLFSELKKEPGKQYISIHQRIWLIDMLLQIVEGAKTFIESGFVPGDIKAENILISSCEKKAWIIDYGGLTEVGEILASLTAEDFTKDQVKFLLKNPICKNLGEKLAGYSILVTFLSGLYACEYNGKDFLRPYGGLSEIILNEWSQAFFLPENLQQDLRNIFEGFESFPDLDKTKEILLNFKGCFEKKFRNKPPHLENVFGSNKRGSSSSSLGSPLPSSPCFSIPEDESEDKKNTND